MEMRMIYLLIYRHLYHYDDIDIVIASNGENDNCHFELYRIYAFVNWVRDTLLKAQMDSTKNRKLS